jgi:uncharacterized protein (TIGR03435 family)
MAGMTRCRSVAAVVGLAAIGTCMPQTSSAQVLPAGVDGDRFDVASVKPSSGARIPLPRIMPGGAVQIDGATLRDLIRMAYPAASGQVLVEGGPGWVMSARFDVTARAPAGAMATATMLRALLTERFGLQARPMTREGTVFSLVMAHHGGRLGPSLTLSACGEAAQPVRLDEVLERAMAGTDADTSCSHLRIGAGPTLVGESITMARFASTLSEFPILSAPVVNRTGLAGTYNLRMQYRGDNNPNADAGPLMPAALQEQLGLKLEKSTGPVDVVVIDRVEQPAPD